MTAGCVSVKICDPLSMSELDFPQSGLRKMEEGGEPSCSSVRLNNSPPKAPMDEIVLCCLVCLTSREAVPVSMILPN